MTNTQQNTIEVTVDKSHIVMKDPRQAFQRQSKLLCDALVEADHSHSS